MLRLPLVWRRSQNVTKFLPPMSDRIASHPELGLRFGEAGVMYALTLDESSPDRRGKKLRLVQINLRPTTVWNSQWAVTSGERRAHPAAITSPDSAASAEAY